MTPLLETALPAAAFAGVVAIGVTVAIERLGGRAGGLIGTLPTTIVPASLGLWAQTGGGEAFQSAMDATPGGMLVSGVFLWLWRVLPPRLPGSLGLGGALTLMIVISLTVWLACAWGYVVGARVWVTGGGDTLWPAALSTALLLGIGVWACLRAPPGPKGAKRVGPLVLVLRGVFAASAIGAAIWLAEVAGPIAGGIAAVFPAIFTTAMASVWLAQGHAVPAGAAGPMMLGSVSVAAYALCARYLFDAAGPAGGAVAAWLIAVASTTVPAWFWLDRKIKT